MHEIHDEAPVLHRLLSHQWIVIANEQRFYILNAGTTGSRLSQWKSW